MMVLLFLAFPGQRTAIKTKDFGSCRANQQSADRQLFRSDCNIGAFSPSSYAIPHQHDLARSIATVPSAQAFSRYVLSSFHLQHPRDQMFPEIVRRSAGVCNHRKTRSLLMGLMLILISIYNIRPDREIGSINSHKSCTFFRSHVSLKALSSVLTFHSKRSSTAILTIDARAPYS